MNDSSISIDIINSSTTVKNLEINSSTAVQQQQDIGSIVVQRVISICLGAVVILLNTAVCLTIYRFAKLRARPELVVFSALAFADILCGLAYVSTGVRSLVQILTNDVRPVYALDCMQLFNVATYILGPELLTVMLFVVSIDRLFSIASIKFYEALPRRMYLPVAVGLPVGFVTCSYGYAWYGTIHQLPNNVHNPDNSCIVGSATTKNFYLFHNVLQLGFSIGSVLVYCAVLVLYRRRTRMVPKLEMDGVERRQVKMTKTVGFMCICTVLLYILPDSLVTYFGYAFMGPAKLQQLALLTCRMFTASYSFINIVVYLLRPSDVRSHMRILYYGSVRNFCGKQPEESDRPFNVQLKTLNPVASTVGGQNPQVSTVNKRTSISGGRSSIVGLRPPGYVDPMLCNPYVTTEMRYHRESKEVRLALKAVRAFAAAPNNNTKTGQTSLNSVSKKPYQNPFTAAPKKPPSVMSTRHA